MIWTATHRLVGAQAYANSVTYKVWATDPRSGRDDALPALAHVLALRNETRKVGKNAGTNEWVRRRR